MTSAITARLTGVASRALPSGVKQQLKQLVRAYHRMFFAFTPADLKNALRHLGVVPGDVMMVHSAFDRFLGFREARSTSFGRCKTSSGPAGR